MDDLDGRVNTHKLWLTVISACLFLTFALTVVVLLCHKMFLKSYEFIELTHYFKIEKLIVYNLRALIGIIFGDICGLTNSTAYHRNE